MRRLIVMRHAKSSWADPGQRDLDRPLNKRGRRAAGLVGGWLKQKGYLPGEALVSTARRAQETWAGVVAAAGAAPTSYVPEIYNAAPETLLGVVRGARDVECLLVLGHQPGVGALARRLLGRPPDGADFDKFPTGATAVIDFETDGWAELGWETGRLADFVAPRELE
jgi:phosphohistidine phosphatase